MAKVEVLKLKYPGADAWQMGDTPELASKLADLIKKRDQNGLLRISYLLPAGRACAEDWELQHHP